MTDAVRPSKKQQMLLEFIGKFIGEHGYSPSYREIMNGCNYTSVATVSLHVNNLIKRGHLIKRDNSARSLELVKGSDTKPLTTNQIKPSEEKWLIEKVEHFFQAAEQEPQHDTLTIQKLQTLLDALRVLGLEGAAQSYIERLHRLKGDHPE